ncbi:MAG: pentapeptide repeat-containing protein [Hoeflea sp.]|uniref:pentapeptide repeat-containing protein n=1 Tax=Hoeflea sp. TaxID=1940281 RepID=UPI00272F8373|nr:pentapeptide repeat-containing protein [Hoeflea sp.]MDP2119497.1 pentapeptide repeat-containing protein [Hoeflea sp.]
MSHEDPMDASDLDAALGDDPRAPPASQAKPDRDWRYRGGSAMLVFIIGVACGIPVAIFMPGFLTDHGSVVLGIVLGAFFFVTIVLSMIFVFRQPLWRWVFQRTEVEVTRFAGPLADVARYAASQKVDEATSAARDFAEIVLARYAWITTRRWLVASITGLIAAMAALAGSALLFEQNKLLRAQSELLAEQNTRIDEQTGLLRTQIALGEAERSVSIVPELLTISSLIGEETTRLSGDGRPGSVFFLEELSEPLRNRIVAATNVARPYRYLAATGVESRDGNAVTVAALSRRADLAARLSSLPGWSDAPPDTTALIDRPLSPERGQIVTMLFNAGIYQTELLSFRGADFSHAEIRLPTLGLMSLRHATLRFADFTWLRIVESKFGAAWLEHARFRNAIIQRADFAGIAKADLEPPFANENAPEIMRTQLAGTDFSRAVIAATSFAHSTGLAVNFDEAAMVDCDFTGAVISAGTFRNALLLSPNFEGADLRSVDFDGAIVFEADFLDRLNLEAAPDSFIASRYVIEPVEMAEAEAHRGFIELSNYFDPARVEGVSAFRIRRVEDFQ